MRYLEAHPSHMPEVKCLNCACLFEVIQYWMLFPWSTYLLNGSVYSLYGEWVHGECWDCVYVQWKAKVHPYWCHLTYDCCYHLVYLNNSRLKIAISWRSSTVNRVACRLGRGSRLPETVVRNLYTVSPLLRCVIHYWKVQNPCHHAESVRIPTDAPCIEHSPPSQIQPRKTQKITKIIFTF